MALNLPFKLVKTTLNCLANKHRERFIEACDNPQEAQKAVRTAIERNAKNPFPDQPVSYKDLSSNLENLSREAVLYYEMTSGSTGAQKKIPYTKSLLKSFERMFLLWSHDLVSHSDLKLETGKFFMSISPQIGSESFDDRNYLSFPVKTLLSPFLVSDPNHHKARSEEEFFNNIALDLLNANDLEILSIWSPTYFLSILNFIHENKKSLAPSLKSQKTRDLLMNSDWEKLWPNLKLISCWNEAQAKLPAGILSKKLPQAFIQGKGLLLTEAPVSIPWSETSGHVPLVNETYLEFLDDAGIILGLHELQEGKSYTVLTSQHNGFLRYNTSDKVMVTHFYKRTPVLKFLGRVGNNCDLAGEKLSEELLFSLTKDLPFNFCFVPFISEKSGYKVFVDEEGFAQNPVEMESILMNIHHYKLARNLGQLASLETYKIKDLGKKYLTFFQEQGMSLGNIKEKILLSNLTQAEMFLKWIEKAPQSSLPDSKV